MGTPDPLTGTSGPVETVFSRIAMANADFIHTFQRVGRIDLLESSANWSQTIRPLSFRFQSINLKNFQPVPGAASPSNINNLSQPYLVRVPKSLA